MTTMREIADTLSNDFVAAVAATERAQIAALDDVSAKLGEARAKRDEAYASVQRKREQAAELVAQSLREEEKCQAEFQVALNSIADDVAQIRGQKSLGTSTPARITN
jgi:hypothetical protein